MRWQCSVAVSDCSKKKEKKRRKVFGRKRVIILPSCTRINLSPHTWNHMVTSSPSPSTIHSLSLSHSLTHSLDDDDDDDNDGTASEAPEKREDFDVHEKMRREN